MKYKLNMSDFPVVFNWNIVQYGQNKQTNYHKQADNLHFHQCQTHEFLKSGPTKEQAAMLVRTDEIL